ncbi:MAG TPA: hypothetical protein VK808_12425, partial [Bacteroidia bacterium]|nr:hypothetical protein [Bacteroidia bacterium]
MDRNRKRFEKGGLKNISLVMVCNIITICSAVAQSSNSYVKDTVFFKKASDSNRYRQKDVMDVITKVTKIRDKEKSDSEYLKPGKILVSVFPAVGYSLSNGVTFILASNFSFYTDNPASTNLSVITINPLYSLKQQVIVP